jgi:magnesium chelatase subunit I
VERREEYEEDPEAFLLRWEPSERDEAERISSAITTLSDVVVDRDILVAIAGLSIELDVDGHRADIVMRKSAQALAALEDRSAVGIDDVEHVAPMVLAHRVKHNAHSGHRSLGDVGEILRSPQDAS